MDVQLHAVRVYGSKSQYGSTPRFDPLGGPLTIREFPKQNLQAIVTLGDVPEMVKTAWRVKKALALTLASVFAGRSGKEEGNDDLIQEFFEGEGVNLPSEECNWCVTVEIWGNDEVRDESTTERKFVWLEPKLTMDLLKQFASVAAPHLDRLVSYLALFIEAGFFSSLLADACFVTAGNRLPLAWPQIECSANIAMTYANSRLDVGGLKRFAESLSERQEPEKSPLDVPRHWFLHAISEEDRARQFMMCFWALEVLAHKLGSSKAEGPRCSTEWALARCLRDALRWLLRGSESALTKRFRALREVLGLEADQSDLDIFKKAKRARDKLSHGAWYDLDSLPVPEAYHLMQKYFLAALRHHVRQDPPSP